MSGNSSVTRERDDTGSVLPPVPGPGGGLPHAAETAAAAQPDHGLGVGPQRVLVKIAASQERRSGLAESRTARERDDGRPSVWILFTPAGREHGHDVRAGTGLSRREVGDVLYDD